MLFAEIGKRENPCVLLIHGMGMDFQKTFSCVIENLKDNYYICIPLWEEGVFENIEKIAKEIGKELKKRKIKIIEFAYGISLGGTILVELIANNEIKIVKVVLDGAQVNDRRYFPYLQGLMIAKQYAKLQKGKNIFYPIMVQMGYKGKTYIDMWNKVINKNVSFKSLVNEATACYSYTVKESMKNLGNVDSYFFVGSNEPYAKHTLMLLKKYAPHIHEVEFSECGHIEAIVNKSSQITEQINQIISGNLNE